MPVATTITANAPTMPHTYAPHDVQCEWTGPSPECDANDKLTRPKKLAALRPTPLLPSKQPKRPRRKAVAALQQIEAVEVTRNEARTDCKVYVVDVYYREQEPSQSRIPVHRHFRPSHSTSVAPRSGAKQEQREPSGSIQIEYDDFLQLRHDAYELAHASHLFGTCAFCQQIVYLATSSALMPRWNSHWSKSNDEVCGMLTAYLTELLKVAAQAPLSEEDAHCHGQEHIPRLLQSFLRSHEQEERRSM